MILSIINFVHCRTMWRISRFFSITNNTLTQLSRHYKYCFAHTLIMWFMMETVLQYFDRAVITNNLSCHMQLTSTTFDNNFSWTFLNALTGHVRCSSPRVKNLPVPTTQFSRPQIADGAGAAASRRLCAQTHTISEYNYFSEKIGVTDEPTHCHVVDVPAPHHRVRYGRSRILHSTANARHKHSHCEFICEKLMCCHSSFYEY